jgi:UPF0716 protein FxsA
MFVRLLFLFIFVPLIEMALLVALGDMIGFWATIVIVLSTGFIGAGLARWQGLKIIHRIKNELAAGRIPGDDLIGGLLVLLAGAVLLTPGVITDLMGFLLLIPWTRRPIQSRFKGWFKGWAIRNSSNIHVRHVNINPEQKGEAQPFDIDINPY